MILFRGHGSYTFYLAVLYLLPTSALFTTGLARAQVEEEEEIEEEEEDTAETAEEPPGPTNKTKGILRIEIIGDHTGQVTIDGNEVGSTPWEDELLPGTYKVEVESPGLPTWKGKVQVTKGQTTTAAVNMESTKKGPSTSTPFWAGLSATVPTLTTGIVLLALSSKYNNEATDLSNALDSGTYDADLELKAKKVQRQHDVVNFSSGLQKGGIAGLVIGGVLAAGTVVSLFVFSKGKPAADAEVETATVAPTIGVVDGEISLGLAGTF